MKKLIIILTIFIVSCLLVLGTIFFIDEYKTEVKYTDEPSNQLIYKRFNNYYFRFDYKGKRYKFNFSDYDWYQIRDNDKSIYIDIRTSFDYINYEKIGTFRFDCIKVTEDSYSMFLYIYFPEKNSYIIVPHIQSLNFNEMFNVTKLDSPLDERIDYNGPICNTVVNKANKE